MNDYTGFNVHICSPGGLNEDLSLPDDRDELQLMRKNIAMELLWVQQAIDSRKNVRTFV